MAGQDSARARARARARSRARLAALGAALVAVVLVAGCGDSEESDGSATPTATASETTTATETPTTATPAPTGTEALPPLPDEATENTPEGAEAFIRYWFDVVNRSYTTPEPGLVPEISDPECVACQGIEEQVASLASADERVKLAPFEVVTMALVGGGAPGVTSFNVTLSQPENEFLSSSGEVVRESAALEKSGEVGAIWEGSKWLLYDSAVN